MAFVECGSSPPIPSAGMEAFFDKVQTLSPRNDAQRSLQAQALSISTSLGQTRWLLVGQSGHSIPKPFLVVLVCWLFFIFVSFGLYVRLNATVVVALFVCALSFSSAIFLILELDAVRGADPDLQRADAGDARTSWPVDPTRLSRLSRKLSAVARYLVSRSRHVGTIQTSAIFSQLASRTLSLPRDCRNGLVAPPAPARH